MSATNESWIARLRANGPVQDEALAELRAILLGRLRRAFLGRTGVDEPLLEDVTQEALLKTLGNLDQFQGRSHFTTWVTTIAVRLAFTELRRQYWKHVSLGQVVQSEHRESGQLAASDVLERDALIQTMYQIIETELTERQRTALLTELNGMPLAEIGRRMGSNHNAIYKLTHDARQRLKQHLEAAGYSAADLHRMPRGIRSTADGAQERGIGIHEKRGKRNIFRHRRSCTGFAADPRAVSLSFLKKPLAKATHSWGPTYLSGGNVRLDHSHWVRHNSSVLGRFVEGATTCCED